MSGWRRRGGWREGANAGRRAFAERATDREVDVVAAVLVTGSEKAAAHRLGLSRSTVKHHLANARSKVGPRATQAAAARRRRVRADIPPRDPVQVRPCALASARVPR